MSDFTKTTNFTAKDALTTGDPNKVIKGAQFDTEFDAMATSSATKSNKVIGGTTNAVIIQTAGGDLSDGSVAAPSSAIVGLTDSQTLTNKTIDSDNNTITNIVNADVKAAAAIDASKIADGTVSSAEFQYINSLSSNAQTQLNAKLAVANNLNDLANAATARSNLSLGALATLATVSATEIDAGAVDTSELATDSVTSAKIDQSVSASGTQTITSGSTWTPAVGFYNVVPFSGQDFYLELNISATWRRSSKAFAGGAVWCDGTETRFAEAGVGSATLYYNKMS